MTLVLQAREQMLLVGNPQGDQFLIALEQIQHRALGNRDGTPLQGLMDLWDTAMLAITQLADQRDHIEAKFPMRQGPGPSSSG
jgi:hypothetical protein